MQNLKENLRKVFLEKRKLLTDVRRKEAANLLRERFQEMGNILSFTSMGSELDTSLLNAKLAKEKRLFIFSEDVPLEEIDCILVPGIVFDERGYRLGYGKGIYDRFLATVGQIPTIGIGFKEQLSLNPLPRDTWDITVQKLLLL